MRYISLSALTLVLGQTLFACTLIVDGRIEEDDPCRGITDGTVCSSGDAGRQICLRGECRDSVCGDDFIDMVIGEQCDDGNTQDDDGCDADCTFTCEVNADCADGLVCNGSERCTAQNTCVGGLLPAVGTPCSEGGVANGVCMDGECQPL